MSLEVGSLGAAAPLCPAAGSAGSAGPCAASLGAGPAAPAGLDGLVSALGNYTSAQILMALWLLAAGRCDDENGRSCGAALGFLAGLALAGQLGQLLDIQWDMPAAGMEGGSTGGTLDASV